MSPLHPILWRRRRIILAVLIVAWLGALTASHLPPGDLPELPSSDTTLHLGGFGLLSVLFLVTLAAFGLAGIARPLVAVGVLALYAMLDEMTQPIFHRTCDIADWLADMGGMVIALAICEVTLQYLAWRHKTRQA